ncbi:hypothetical protein MASR2M78_02990 [Treponema sp.]
MRDMENKASSVRTVKAIIIAFVVALCIKTFVIDFMIAEGNSMKPALASGTVFILNRAAYGIRVPFSSNYLLRWAEPSVGDILVFPSPDGRLAIKRCVELVPPNRFIALGDNKDESYDSRSYGSLSIELILGRVVGLR